MKRPADEQQQKTRGRRYAKAEGNARRGVGVNSVKSKRVTVYKVRLAR